MSDTFYSQKEIPGDRTNYRWSVSFDLTSGTLGISQQKEDRMERVLLSAKQVEALLGFLKSAPKKYRARAAK